MSLLSVIIVLLIAGVIFCLFWFLIGLLPITDPNGTKIKNFLRIVLIVLAVIWLLVKFSPFLGIGAV